MLDLLSDLSFERSNMLMDLIQMSDNLRLRFKVWERDFNVVNLCCT